MRPHARTRTTPALARMAHRPHYRLLVGLPHAITHATRPRPLRASSRFWLAYRPGRLRAVLANRRLGSDSRRVLRLLIP
jgi:hypothetical protein